MLLYRRAKIELITDIDILLFLESNIGGGVNHRAMRMTENEDDPDSYSYSVSNPSTRDEK